MSKLFKKRLLNFILIFILTITSFTLVTYAWTDNTYIYNQDILGKSKVSYFASGSGVFGDPFVITEPEHFFNLSYLQNQGYFNDGNAPYYFKVADSNGDSTTIDFSQAIELYQTIPPIGNNSYPFIGDFDGNFSTMKNVTVDGDGEQDIGVFGHLGDNSTVSDLFIETPTILSNPSTSDSHTGFHTHNDGVINRATGYIAGHLNAAATLTNVYVVLPSSHTTVMAQIDSSTNDDDNRSEYGLIGYTEAGGGTPIGSPQSAYDFDLDAVSAKSAMTYAYNTYSSDYINGSTSITLGDVLSAYGELSSGYSLSTIMLTLVSNATANHTLVRDSSVTKPNSIFSGYEWTANAQDDTTDIGSHTATDTASELYISEYGEGSGSNQWIELYNNTGSTINLSNYSIELYANGSSTATGTLTLSGTLANSTAYVIANPSANSTILAAASASGTTNSSVTSFDGNDALVLKENTNIIDVIGLVGEDPGAGGWNLTNYLYDQIASDGYPIEGSSGAEYSRENLDVVGVISFGSSTYQIYQNIGSGGNRSPYVDTTFDANDYPNAIFLYVKPTNDANDLGNVTGTYSGGGQLSYLSSYDSSGNYVENRYWKNSQDKNLVSFGSSGVTQTMTTSSAFCAVTESTDAQTGEVTLTVVDETVLPDYYVFLVAVTNGQITISDINFSYQPADPQTGDYDTLGIGDVDFITSDQRTAIIANPSSYTNSYFYINYDITVNQSMELYLEKVYDGSSAYYYNVYINYDITDSSLFYFDFFNINSSDINIWTKQFADSSYTAAANNPYSDKLFEIRFTSSGITITIL